MDLKEPILAYWYRALSTEFGIELTCNDAEAARNRLYSARREAKDTDLEVLSVCLSPFDATKLWIVKTKRSSNEPPT